MADPRVRPRRKLRRLREPRGQRDAAPGCVRGQRRALQPGARDAHAVLAVALHYAHGKVRPRRRRRAAPRLGARDACARSRRYMHVGGHRTQSHLVQDYEQNYVRRLPLARRACLLRYVARRVAHSCARVGVWCQLRALKEAGYFVLYHGKNDAFSQTAFNLSVSEWSNDIGAAYAFPPPPLGLPANVVLAVRGAGYASGSNYFQYPEPGYFSFLSTGSNTSGAGEPPSVRVALPLN